MQEDQKLKKLIIAVAALAVAVIGFGALGSTVTQANPSKIWLINENVAKALNTHSPALPTDGFTCNVVAANGVDALSSQLDTFAAASAGQFNADTTNAGLGCIVVKTDGSLNPVTLNTRGLTTGAVVGPTAGTNGTWATAEQTAGTTGSAASGSTVTVTQDSVSLDSSAMTIATQAHDVALAVTKATIQENSSSCALTDSTSDPARGGAGLTFTDINGTALVGYGATFTSSATGTMTVASPVSLSMLIAGTTVTAAGNVYCGVAAGTAVLSATAPGSEISGITTGVTRTSTITVTGVPAAIALTASPAAIPCDGTSTSTVTAKVTDSAGNNVVDNTPVTFSVVALGTANPINTKTTGGSATSTITPLSGGTAGVVVQVTSGSAASSVRIDCLPSLATATAAAGGGAATATPRTGITGPNTGTGGYLGNNSSSGFPMWTLIALALGSFVLVGGGIVARRSK